MFRAQPQRVHVVYSTLDPDMNGEADREKYLETLDAAHLGDVSKLTPIELHTLTVPQRVELRSRVRGLMANSGTTFEELLGDARGPAFFAVYPKLCALQVRASLRRVGDVKFTPDADGYAPEESLDLLQDPDVVEEIAGYIRDISHLGPPGGGSGGDG